MTNPHGAAVDASGPPLPGVLVADFSRVLAGPFASMMLADLGATVIKVEHPSRGDDTRHWGPPWTPDGSFYFESANRSKSSASLDFTTLTTSRWRRGSLLAPTS